MINQYGQVRLSGRHPLYGKVTLVTGASSGIGKGLAIALASCGANLLLVGRRLETLESVSEVIRNTSTCVRPYVCDLLHESQIQSLAVKVREDYGCLDILVHSAGVFSQSVIDTTSDAEFERQSRTNLLAPHSLTRALAPTLRARMGQIVFVNSSVARGARAMMSQYAATKAGLKAVADSLREEFNPDGVRVLSVFAGRVASPMQEAIFKQEGRAYHSERLLTPSDIASVVINCLSLPPNAEVTEIDIRPMMKA